MNDSIKLPLVELNTPIAFKYQTQFACSVPDGYTVIRDFNELIASDSLPTEDSIRRILTLSFESSNVDIKSMYISKDLNHCDVVLGDDPTPVRIIIRVRPSLVIDGNIYKLEEFDI